MLTESKESTGGMAFDVILKPALQNSPPVVLMRNVPSKDISQEDIDKKMKEAEERRIVRMGGEIVFIEWFEDE